MSIFYNNTEVDASTGNYHDNNGFISTKNMISVKSGTTLYSNYVICGIYAFDSNMNYIGRSTTYSTTLNIPSNAAYIRIELNKNHISYENISNLVISDNETASSVSYINDQVTSSVVDNIVGNHTLYAKWTTMGFDANHVSFAEELDYTYDGQAKTPTMNVSNPYGDGTASKQIVDAIIEKYSSN